MAQRVSDLTIDEFRRLIRETVLEVFQELSSDRDDEDDLEFRPEVAEQLRAYLRDKPSGRTLEEIAKDLAIDV